jgi:hypothetical protein
MTDGAMAGTAAVAMEEAIANAVKASGAIVSVEPRDFETILRKTETPLVVRAQGGVFTTKYHYLTPYKGLIFYTRTETPLLLPPKTELVNARKIWVPS